mgnify:CR=1 FL=1
MPTRNRSFTRSVNALKLTFAFRGQFPFTLAFPLDLQAQDPRAFLDELAHRVLLTGSNHIVIGFFLLQDQRLNG